MWFTRRSDVDLNDCRVTLPRRVSLLESTTVLWKRAMGLYCPLENGSFAVPSLLVNRDESQPLVIVKFGKHFGFCSQQKIIGFIGFI